MGLHICNNFGDFFRGTVAFPGIFNFIPKIYLGGRVGEQMLRLRGIGCPLLGRSPAAWGWEKNLLRQTQKNLLNTAATSIGVAAGVLQRFHACRPRGGEVISSGLQSEVSRAWST